MYKYKHYTYQCGTMCNFNTCIHYIMFKYLSPHWVSGNMLGEKAIKNG
jgi:hypothetical protein